MSLYLLLFLLNVALLYVIYFVVRSHARSDDKETRGVLKITLVFLAVIFAVVVVWQLEVFDVFKIHASTWNPAKDNKVSAPVAPVPRPESPDPLTEKEATQAAVDEHNSALKAFEESRDRDEESHDHSH